MLDKKGEDDEYQKFIKRYNERTEMWRVVAIVLGLLLFITLLIRL